MSPIWLALLAVVSIVLFPTIQPAARAQGPTGVVPSLDARVTSVRFFEIRVHAPWQTRLRELV